MPDGTLSLKVLDVFGWRVTERVDVFLKIRPSAMPPHFAIWR
jgi:hypothetical protein